MFPFPVFALRLWGGRILRVGEGGRAKRGRVQFSPLRDKTKLNIQAKERNPGPGERNESCCD